jgi:hypothetical protein
MENQFYRELYKHALPDNKTTDVIILREALGKKFQDVNNFKSYVLAGGPAIPYKGEYIDWGSYGFISAEDLARLRATTLSMIVNSLTPGKICVIQ